MDDERPQKGRGEGHVTYFLSTNAFAGGSVTLPISTPNTYREF